MIKKLLSEIDRCNDLLKFYDEIPQGVFGAIMIRKDIEDAKEAIASGDTVEMLRSLKKLERCE